MRLTLHAFLLISLLFLFCGCMPKTLAPRVLREGVRFFCYAPDAHNVSIAGSFNRWSPEQDQLTGPDRKGIWTILLSLSPGRYEYRFIVDGKEWVLDPSVPSVDDGLGDRNSLFVVEP